MNTKTKKKSPMRPLVRRLTISETVRFNRYSSTAVPYLRLSGNWMEKLGFTANQKVLVTTMEGLLLIRKAEY